MPATILVTGSTGNVGREVARQLESAGHPVAAATHSEQELARAPAGARTVLLDFTRPDTFPAALRGVGRIFLVRPPAIADVENTLNPFVDAARAAGVQQIVFLSLMGVEHNRRVPHYGVEQKIKASGVSYTFLRPSFFMQNLDTFYRDGIRCLDELYIPAGRGKTSFIDVRDIGAAAALVLTEAGHAGRAYTLTGSQALDYYQVAEAMTSALGRRITYAAPSPAAYKRRMEQLGVDPQFIQVMLGLYWTVRMGLGAAVANDVQELLHRPPIRLDQYLADYAERWAPDPAKKAEYLARLSSHPVHKPLFERLISAALTRISGLF